MKRMKSLIQRLAKAPGFQVRLRCKNCEHHGVYVFPKGTRVIRAPYLGHPNAETRVILPDGTHQTIKCRRCEIGNVA